MTCATVLCVGKRAFDSGCRGAGESMSRQTFESYQTASGTFVDTAEIYFDGVSKELVGIFIRDSKSRVDIVPAKKFDFDGSSIPQASTPGGGGKSDSGEAR
ncbi:MULTISPECIES: aldo/keto reductase [unclassified Salipiger]|uniref:aldo/keto reductase n=1 Tax=Salipiger sp. PrR002 TaxID=2706489 RepID=UPI0013B88379|nr:hypothetical protein [Salipiger sp. PrR002]NDW57904.1 hypothetical protein [Salipiger sp. PrR004]